MTPYVYECPEHGQFISYFTMGEAAEEQACPIDGNGPCYRVITAPTLHGETVSGGLGGSGDGYAFDSKSGWTSRPGKKLNAKERRPKVKKDE